MSSSTNLVEKITDPEESTPSRSSLQKQTAGSNIIGVYKWVTQALKQATTGVCFGDCFFAVAKQLRVIVKPLPHILPGGRYRSAAVRRKERVDGFVA